MVEIKNVLLQSNAQSEESKASNLFLSRFMVKESKKLTNTLGFQDKYKKKPALKALNL